MSVSKHREKIIFVIVGASAAFAYYAAYLTLKSFGISTASALFVSHLVGMSVSYTGHALFTFNKRLANLSQVARYVIANLFGALVVAGIGHVIWKFFPNDIVILIVATVVATAMNYLLFKFFVYVEDA